ncbi:hypothetical protein [Georgfuchsia toluolica]|uniref:hypothetical protein n=1 Tax=Georgfuchsia toluolica TaxID=424218 RepID=UPI001C7365A2|nr:hypothetical protein [Georgfuchsia toluolica]
MKSVQSSNLNDSSSERLAPLGRNVVHECKRVVVVGQPRVRGCSCRRRTNVRSRSFGNARLIKTAIHLANIVSPHQFLCAAIEGMLETGLSADPEILSESLATVAASNNLIEGGTM